MANAALLDGLVNAGSPPPPTGGGPVTPGRYSQATVSAGSPVGTAPLTAVHNTPLHIAIFGLGAIGVVVIMHKWGFHLVSAGRYGGGR